MNEITAPHEVKKFLQDFVRLFQMYFGQRLVGVYLHGSLAMGCYNSVSSDIDILVVVREKLDVDSRHGIGQRLLELSETAPANGLEMSIVTLQCVEDFQYPTPYELHFSHSNKSGCADGTVDLVGQRTDPDLAAHFVITKARHLLIRRANRKHIP
jgi:streptomycin 3"-adenylyltransferase